MKAALILESDVLDIVFENRNKLYGAYNLRKFYDNRLMKSIGTMIGIVLLLSAFTFLPKKKIEKYTVVEAPTGTIIKEADKKEEKKEEKKVQPKTKDKPTNTKKLLSNIVITKTEKTDTLKTIDTKDNISGITNIVPGEPGTGIIKPDTGGKDVGGEGPGETEPKLTLDVNTPREEAEFRPAFPGGITALKKFLQRNLNNPKDMEEGEEVTVKMKFVVGIDGKLQSFETVKDGGEEFNKEVIRVLKKMPNWVPGKSSGQNVAVYFTIPVKFIPAN